jgi:hypothetical protein
VSRYAYTVTMPRKSLATLEWLSARGYDANFLNLAARTDDDDNGGWVSFGLTEPEAWVFSSNVESDGHAFLTCNADQPLADALLGLLGRIV